MFLNLKFLVLTLNVITSLSDGEILTIEISCVNNHHIFQFEFIGEDKLQTCVIGDNYKINLNGFKFSNDDDYDEKIKAISFSHNSNIFYLPDKVYEKFPEIQMFEAKNCKIGRIEASNFEKLNSLIAVDLSNNLIKSVPFDVFKDSRKLQVISLSEI